MDAVCGFVMAGLGIAVIPSMVAFRQPLRTTPFAPPGLHRTIGLAHRRDVEPPRAARELRATLVDFVANAAAADMLPPGVRPAPNIHRGAAAVDLVPEVVGGPPDAGGRVGPDQDRL
jgi:hypothetical protein